MRLTVIGVDHPTLHPDADRLLSTAGMVAGGRRHLAAFTQRISQDAERVVIGNLDAVIPRIAAHDGDVVVLASGDPGFFGILRRLRAEGLEPTVLPAASSAAHAFARIGLPWDDALVVSAHGRAARPALAAALVHPKVAILTDDAVDLVPELLEAGRRVVACERLGAIDERVIEVTHPTLLRHPHVLLSLDPATGWQPAPVWLAGHRAGPEQWALPEEEFEHRDRMITKTEVRALVLARLGPQLGQVIWDVGTGSGSVAVECARFGAYVVAIDDDPAQCARARENAAAYGVVVRVVEADATAPRQLEHLPPPDAVFVGGGSLAAIEAALAARPTRIVLALAAIDRVGPALRAVREAGYVADGTQLAASRIGTLPDGAVRLVAENPVTVIWGRREAGT
ncbi:MAG: hypothetical protein JWM67_2246 [Mycobacterium sp.]|nr:hypothetical protein [Mycobacterium sp.]